MIRKHAWTVWNRVIEKQNQEIDKRRCGFATVVSRTVLTSIQELRGTQAETDHQMKNVLKFIQDARRRQLHAQT
jgi:hypothetical protein